MKKYEVSISSDAMEDLRKLFNVIAYEYKTRRTAVNISTVCSTQSIL